jgi:outer membrane protein OmpA-like peptidoglycan-associated protein
LKELKGCPPAPVLKAEEQKILEKAFASLEFASGKDIIKTTSFASLNELAGLMKLHATDWTLDLAGHTDNQGDAAKNMLLSEKRTKAVKKYLVTKGVKADRVMTKWFGQTVPIADNTTEAGRQKNRRVEMKVVFK